MTTNHQGTTACSKGKLVVFWAYVLIPLTWGVVNTLLQAMKLFS